MSDRFKFRIYSFLEKSFHYFSIGDCEDGYPQGIAGGVSEIQQYTGCHDSSNKDIYEGDIVKWGNLNYIVEWNHTAYKWQGRCPYYHPYNHPTTEHFRDLMNGVIVGNIFENKELLS